MYLCNFKGRGYPTTIDLFYGDFRLILTPRQRFARKFSSFRKKFVIKNSPQSAFFDRFSVISLKIVNALLQIHNAIAERF
jgi:hypothetical protein